MNIKRLNKFFWWLYRKSSSSDSFSNEFDSESKQAINAEVKRVLNREFYEAFTVEGLQTFVEWYPSIPVLIDVVNNRKHNVAFEHKNASHEDSFEFTNTQTYEEAVRLLLKGWPTILAELQDKKCYTSCI